MGKWKEYYLGDICSLITDGKHGNCKDEENSGYYFLSAKDVFNGKLHYENARQITMFDFTETDRRTNLQAGDMLITNSGTIGRIALALNIPETRRTTFQKSVAVLKPINDYLHNRFFYYAMLGNYSRLVELAEGTTQQNLLLGELRKFSIKIPEIPEQKAIASVLSSLDDKIDLLHRQNKTLEAMAETLFRQWFVEEVREDWIRIELGQFVEVIRGLSYKGSGLSSKDSGIPMHNLNSVYEGGDYKYEGIKYYSGDYKERHLVSPGDVIITNTEQGHDLLLIGFPAIVPRFFGDSSIFSQHIFKLAIRDTYILEPFLYYLLMSYDVREQITGATNGSTVNMLPKNGIEWAKFKLPPEFRIKEFTTIVEALLEKKEFIHAQIQSLEKLRNTLLPKLMSGEVRAQYDKKAPV